MKKTARIFFCLATVLMLIAAFGFPCAGAEKVPDLYLECRTDPSGMIILNIMSNPRCAPLCGLEIDAVYDAELLYLSSCERGQGASDMSFDCSLRAGRIRLLFWSKSNCALGGNIATVCFVPRQNIPEGERCEFYLSLPTKSSAIAFDGSNIIAKELTLSGLVFVLSAEGQENEIPSDTEDEQQPTEPPSETPSESATDVKPSKIFADKGQNTTDVPSKLRKKSPQKLVFAMLAAATLFSAFELMPLFVPKVFRKGYF